MDKKFFISWVVIFVVSLLGGFVVHGVLLGADYAAQPNLFRPDAEAQNYFSFMLAAHIIMSGAFVWVYARGNENKPWLQQGLRYGVAIAFLVAVPTYMIHYAVQPMPGMLVVKQIIFDSALMVILGVVVAFLNKPQTAPASA
ncbi:MAG: hypothetical protein ACE1Z7_08635 [Woeseiaceae bacterium]